MDDYSEKVSEWKDFFQPHILERGLRYAQAGAVSDLVKTNDSISAVVRGSEYYSVRINYSGDEISDGYCSCPYAESGEWCKHMAAVLYTAEEGIEQDSHSGMVDQKDSSECIRDIIESADRKKINALLLDMANRDYRTENYIRVALEKKKTIDIKVIEKEIDAIFDAYSDQSGYINYHNVMDFDIELDNLLRNRIEPLIEENRYLDAFNASIYSYVKLGNCDIDDDGEVESLSRTCYELWLEIISKCSSEEKEIVKNWFEAHHNDGTVIDYMEDILNDFLKYELASDEELKEQISKLEDIVERCSGDTTCDEVFSSYYGYRIEAIELRNMLAKRIGATDDDIEEYLKEHMNFSSVRRYFIEKARKKGDIEEGIQLLKISKEYDNGSKYMVHAYSERLIELYRYKKDKAAEKAERREDILSNSNDSMEDYRSYRRMCSKEEWKEERVKIISSKDSIEAKCELLADERMLDDLMKIIWAQKDKLVFLNKYGFLLADDYSEFILDYYSQFVSGLAETVCNRARYNELHSYLMRMAQYSGGKKMVRQLALKWIDMYPTRKVMVQMLEELPV